MRENDFTGKICLVTGGTQGVGEATAFLMAERGAAGIVICGRQQDAGRQVEERLAAKGTPALFVRADLSKVEDCFAVVDAAKVRFGALHVVANVAGCTDRGTIDTTDPATFDRLFAINTRAPFFIMQRVIPLMREAGGGTIVNVISISAYAGSPVICAYVGSKAALMGLTKNIAYSVRNDRIRVNGLNMGWTATPGEERIQKTAHGLGDDWQDEIADTRPFGRLLTSEEVARGICFLAGDESALMTGAVVDFDQTVVGAYD